MHTHRPNLSKCQPQIHENIVSQSIYRPTLDSKETLVENIETLPSAVEKFEEPSQSMLPKQWKYAVLGIVLVVGCVLLFKFYKKKK